VKWRGSRFRRWITWLRSLLRVGEGFDFEWPQDFESDFVHEESQRSRRQRFFRKEKNQGLRFLGRSPFMSDFRKGERPRRPIIADPSSRYRQLREILPTNRTRKNSSSPPFLVFRKPKARGMISAEPRSYRAPTTPAARSERGRIRALDEVKLMAERPLQNQPEQSLTDSKNPESATFSPPFSTRLRHKPKPAKPGREPPLWLSLGPHLARQLKQ
jgi:hypothetical protein